MNSKYYILLIENFSCFKLRYLLLCAFYHNDFYASHQGDIFLERYGLLDGTPKTLQETSLIFGLSREIIRQIVGRTIVYIKAKCKKDKKWQEVKEHLEKISVSLLKASNNGFLKKSQVTTLLKNEFGCPDMQLFYLVNELLPYKLEVCNDTKTSVSNIQAIALEVIKTFPNKYGKAGWVKILKGLPLNPAPYNHEIVKSHFYGKLKDEKQHAIANQIQKMIDENLIVSKKMAIYSLLSPVDQFEINDSVSDIKPERTLEEWVNIIKNIVTKNQGWMEIDEIARLMHIKRHDYLIKDDHLTTIAHLIRRFLKKEGFKTQRINYEKGYSIVVVAPQYAKQSIPDKYFIPLKER